MDDDMVKKETAQGGQTLFKRGGTVRFQGTSFIAPDLKNLCGEIVTIVPSQILGAGLKVVKVYHRGQYVTDAFNDLRVPYNKKLYGVLEECTEKQQGLYL